MNKEIEISKKSLGIVLLVLLVVVAGIIWWSLPKPEQEALEVVNNQTGTIVNSASIAEEGNTLGKPLFSETIKGIDASVYEVKRKESETIVTVTLSNHRFDLADPEIVGRTTLNGIVASEFVLDDSQMGGHHVEGKFIFSGELEGELIIGITEDIIFNFNEI